MQHKQLYRQTTMLFAYGSMHQSFLAEMQVESIPQMHSLCIWNQVAESNGGVVFICWWMRYLATGAFL